MRPYRLTVTMISPVHVGTGEALAPTDFVVRRRVENERDIYHEMLVIDMPKFLRGLDRRQRPEFDKAVDAKGPGRVLEFIERNVSLEEHVLYRCWTSEDLHEACRRDRQSDRGVVSVYPMVRSHLDHRPILPGSSIKGAIRVAILDQLAQKHAAPGNLETIDPRDFQAEVLGYRVVTEKGPRRMLTADPFRALRVADATLPANAISVDPVVLLRPGAKTEPRVDQYHEMTFSALDDEVVEAVTTLTLDNRLAARPTNAVSARWPFEHCVAQALSVPQILGACRAFYVPRLQQECRKFFSSGPHLDVAKKIFTIRIAENEAVIRLGRFSHFECVTVDRFCHPPQRGVGSTRSLASGAYPMGWAKIRIDPV